MRNGFIKILYALPLLFLLSCGGAEGPEFHEKQKVLMGTLFKIKVFRGSSGITRERFAAIADKAFDEVARLEAEMSEWREDSPVSKAAAKSGLVPVKITPDIATVVETALAVSAETGGAFDISFKPLGKVWDVKKRKAPPAEEEVKRALALVDYRSVVLDRRNMTLFLKKKGMSIGLGGVAKGYAAGKAGEVLKEAGLNNFVMDAGGDLFVSGSKGDSLWSTGIKNPEGGFFARFRIKGGRAVVTSGDYENFFIYEGVKYHHIIDPRTGYPARGLKSVTVIAEDPALADAYATSFFIIGYEKALEIAKRRKGVEFIMIDDGGNILKSPGLENAVELF
jgi:thiamine biosynthesis lipoprotein